MLALVAAGVTMFFLSLKQNNQPSNKVALQEVVQDPVPSPAIVTSPEGGQETGFAVQVYSFGDKNRAQAALTNLKNNGYKAYLVISDLGPKGIWYRVRIGGLQNELQARAMLNEVRKIYHSGFIVKPKK